ncbi:hypothetical protein [Zhihengliuella halotolerans]|uniref:WXG100 family type VII secretion target n=1 Tax=Zhihengliuella halotolerans TaxID=370736 RepID=A0A4Q8AES7_9MICC|nr:hypothetical protein [Zhihengliuella halotolerans]RZU62694.1 hypothetical protein EV380_2296 [Zhihengliuella halotolerans]
MSAQLFEVVLLDDPAAIRDRAAAYAEAASTVRTSAENARNHWQTIDQHYNAVEAFTVASAMNRPAYLAEQLDDVADSARTALAKYADELDNLATRRSTLLDDIATFNASGPGIDDLPARDEAIFRLRDRCHNLAQSKDDAQNRCVQALRGLSTNIAQDSARPKRVPTAAESDDIHDPTPGTAVQVARNAGVIPGDSFDDGLDTLKWAAEHYGTALGAGSNYFTHNLTKELVGKNGLRADWVPKDLAQLASTNRLVGRFTEKVLDWTPTHGVAPDTVLDINDSRHPFHKPAGVADAGRKFVQRGLAFMNPENLIPKEGLDASRDLWRNVGKWAGRAGGAVGAGFTAVASWQEDSLKHPEMSEGEKGARTAVVTGATTAAAIGGAKAGAVLGATIGTFLGPGPGTAAGAVVGGIIGGVAAGFAASAADRFLKDLTSDAYRWGAGLFERSTR